MLAKRLEKMSKNYKVCYGFDDNGDVDLITVANMDATVSLDIDVFDNIFHGAILNVNGYSKTYLGNGDAVTMANQMLDIFESIV